MEVDSRIGSGGSTTDDHNIHCLDSCIGVTGFEG